MSANGNDDLETVIPDIDQIFIDYPNADVILRSSDNVDFRFSKSLLSLASSVFETMFKLPRSLDMESKDLVVDDLPVVLVEEKSGILEKLLRFCYPVAAKDIPDLTTLEDVQSLLGAAVKYEMEGLEQHVKRALVAPEFGGKEPLRVFAIACRFKLDDVIQIAAKYTLDQPILERPYIAELEFITGGHLHQVQTYYADCAEAAKGVGINLCWLKEHSFVWFRFQERSRRCSCVEKSIGVGNPAVTVWAMQWWRDYLQSTIKALGHRPCGDEIRKPVLTEEAIMKAALCPICRERAVPDLRLFNQLYAIEVDRVVSEVSVIDSAFSHMLS